MQRFKFHIDVEGIGEDLEEAWVDAIAELCIRDIGDAPADKAVRLPDVEEKSND